MKKYKFLSLFLLLSFFACNDKESFFEVSIADLKLNYRSVPGGAILKYTLPNERDIFAVNISYYDNNGNHVLKSCGYSGDSILLDGFSKAQRVQSQISFVNNYGKESQPFDFEFTTEDSAPWSFFDNLEINNSWDGFTVVYGKSNVATGLAHIFYLGKNPMNQKQDTVLMMSFPINKNGDTLNMTVKQDNPQNTIIVRTEDFAGYRVRQEIFPNIEAFQTQKLVLTEDNFNDGGISIENIKQKTGVKYLFDGELRGRERLSDRLTNPSIFFNTFATYLAGPSAIDHVFILDMKEEKIPAKIRIYSIYPLRTTPPAGDNIELGNIWNGEYNDKVPCDIIVYGSNDILSDDSWVKLCTYKDDPRTGTPWYGLPSGLNRPSVVEDLETRDPLFIEMTCPTVNNSYRYLKLIINDTYQIVRSTIDTNRDNYITMHELEVYVKKD